MDCDNVELFRLSDKGEEAIAGVVPVVVPLLLPLFLTYKVKASFMNN